MKKNWMYLVFGYSFLLMGCSSDKGMQLRTVEEYYTPTGVEKYFLTDLPAWANFDQKAGCSRLSNIRYFNIGALMKSYSVSYSQSLQIQGAYNDEFLKIKKTAKTNSPMLKEEELLFYKVSEKVASNIVFFDAPVFKRINLIFLDEVVGDEKKEKKLKSFVSSAVMDVGVPVLVSFCLTRDEVEKMFPDLNVKMITAELFSVYNSQGNATSSFKFELDQFFKPEQKLYFYSQKNWVPGDELKGTLNILNY